MEEEDGGARNDDDDVDNDDAVDDDDDGEDDITFSQSFLRMILSGLVALRFGTNQNREVITNIVASPSPSRLRGVPNAHC